MSKFLVGDTVQSNSEFSYHFGKCYGVVVNADLNSSTIRNYNSNCEELDFMTLFNSDLELVSMSENFMLP